MSARSVDAVVADLVRFLETGAAPDGLFAPDLFADVALPRWREQTTTAADLVAVRRRYHPHAGRVVVERVDRTDDGFVLQLTEHWRDADGDWSAREAIRADVADGAIVDLAVYCTGDWDEALRREHAEAVALVRP